MKNIFLALFLLSGALFATDSNDSLTPEKIFNFFKSSPSEDKSAIAPTQPAHSGTETPDDGSLTPAKIFNFFRGTPAQNKELNNTLKAAPLTEEPVNGANLGTLGLVDPKITPQSRLDVVAPKPRAAIQKQLLSISADGKSAMIDASELRRGISGLVWQQLDDTHRMLVARAYISTIKSDKAKIVFTVLDDTAQPALPTVLNRPKVGDNVVFYLLEDRGIIIAPTQTDYQNAIWALPPELKLVHPDLLAAFLTPIRNAEPKAKQFRAFCANVQATNAYFVLSDGIYKTDCFTLTVLEKYPFQGSKEPEQKPFYNRIGEIPTGYFGLYKEEMKDYQSYYRDLLGIKK
ncbi:MAG: hypothetical protein RL154_703 [Pseudomonadota bacterium]|jgi:hypothetical protein